MFIFTELVEEGDSRTHYIIKVLKVKGYLEVSLKITIIRDRLVLFLHHCSFYFSIK